MMTKKDFIAIANVIVRMKAHKIGISGPVADAILREMVAAEFADWLESTNPQFDRERFLKAATGE